MSIIKLNVGGKYFETLIDTARKIPYIQYILDEATNNNNNTIFIDRCPSLFKHVLRLARNPKYDYPLEYKSELDFYDMNYVNNMVNLNVGGTRFIVGIENLKKMNFFTQISNGNYNDCEGININRCPKLFTHVLRLTIDPKYNYPMKYKNELDFYGVEYIDSQLYEPLKEHLNVISKNIMAMSMVISGNNNIIANINHNLTNDSGNFAMFSDNVNKMLSEVLKSNRELANTVNNLTKINVESAKL